MIPIRAVFLLPCDFVIAVVELSVTERSFFLILRRVSMLDSGVGARGSEWCQQGSGNKK